MALKEYCLWLADAPNDPPTRFEFFEETEVDAPNVGRWVEVLRTTTDWDGTASAGYDDNADPTLYTVATVPPTVESLVAALRVDLDGYALGVYEQGVIGPKSKGPDSAFGQRVWRTDSRFQAMMNGRIAEIEDGMWGDKSVPAAIQVPLITKWKHRSRNGENPADADVAGDTAVLDYDDVPRNPDGTPTGASDPNDNSIVTLRLRITEHINAVFGVHATKGLEVEQIRKDWEASPQTQADYDAAVAAVDAYDVSAPTQEATPVPWPTAPTPADDGPLV